MFPVVPHWFPAFSENPLLPTCSTVFVFNCFYEELRNLFFASPTLYSCAGSPGRRAKWHLGGGLACAARGRAAAHRNPNERASLEMTCGPELGRGESSKIEN